MKKQNKVAFFNILSTVLLKGISLFSAPIFSRMLGTNGYGIVSIYNTWVNVSAIALTLQTNGTLVNARVEYPEDQQQKYQSSVMFLSLAFFLLCSTIVIIFLPQVSWLLKLPSLLVLLMLFQSFGNFCVHFLNNKFTYEFKADKNMYVAVGIALSTLILSILLIQLMPPEINYYGRILAIAITYGSMGVAVSGYVLWKGRTFYNRDYWKLALTLALPVVFYRLSDLLLGQCDRVMLQRIMNESMVGQYSLAYAFGGIIFTIFEALNHSWVPFYFEDMKQGKQGPMRAQAKNFLETYTVLAVGFMLLAPEVYHVFASREFWPGTSLIPIFVTSYYLNFLCTFPINYEYFHKKTKAVATVTVAISLINIGLNYVLITTIGVAGAALATAAAHAIQLTGHYVYVRYVMKKGDYPFGIRLWAKYAIIFFGMVAFVYLTDGMWLLRWAVGAAIGMWELWRIKQRKVLI